MTRRRKTEPAPFQVHEPMAVTIITEGNGTWPDIPLDQDWSDLDQLRWCAGVLEARTGIRLKITTGGITVNGREVPGLYGYSTLGSGGGAYDFGEMWVFLHGIEVGARLKTGLR